MTALAPLETYRIEISPPYAGERLDAALTALMGAQGTALSRVRIRALIEAGHVQLEPTPKNGPARGATVMEPKRRVKPGESYLLALPPPEPATPAAQEIPLSIVYEDEDLIVIDKPAGLVVHPAPGNPDLTLVNALLAHCGQSLSGIGGIARPGIVHRLDKDTSGLMLAAKTDLAHQGLAAQFAAHGRDGRLTRAYHAFLLGSPGRAHGTIDAPLGRNPLNRKVFAVNPKGKPAITHYRLLTQFGRDKASLVECRLETGRTHQIRVHMAHLGHPVLGDPLYGARRNRGTGPVGEAARALGRQALHAAELGFVHPRSGARLSFRSPLPGDLIALERSLEAL
jgi:23S rRNA pseudouridine1911/1915/1917 synthase